MCTLVRDRLSSRNFKDSLNSTVGIMHAYQATNTGYSSATKDLYTV